MAKKPFSRIPEENLFNLDMSLPVFACDYSLGEVAEIIGVAINKVKSLYSLDDNFDDIISKEREELSLLEKDYDIVRIRVIQNFIHKEILKRIFDGDLAKLSIKELLNNYALMSAEIKKHGDEVIKNNKSGTGLRSSDAEEIKNRFRKRMDNNRRTNAIDLNRTKAIRERIKIESS